MYVPADVILWSQSEYQPSRSYRYARSWSTHQNNRRLLSEPVTKELDLLPEIRECSDYFVFQQDGAPAHRARETVAISEPRDAGLHPAIASLCFIKRFPMNLTAKNR